MVLEPVQAAVAFFFGRFGLLWPGWEEAKAKSNSSAERFLTGTTRLELAASLPLVVVVGAAPFFFVGVTSTTAWVSAPFSAEEASEASEASSPSADEDCWLSAAVVLLLLLF